MTLPGTRNFGTLFTYLALTVSFVGLVYSPALLSIGLIMICLVGAVAMFLPNAPSWTEYWIEIRTSSLFWGLAGLYLYLLFTFAQTEDWAYYTERLRIKIPLLLLPLAFGGIVQHPELKIPGRYPLSLVLCTAASVVMMGVLANYALHYAEINDMIRRAQPMPVPRGNHIRFSLLIAILSVVGVDGWFRYRSRWLAGMGVFLFLGLHLLAVRSGLATAYAGMTVVLVGHAVLQKNYRYLISGGIVLTLLPVLAYTFVPTFRTKLQYMRYELLHRDVTADTGSYSDTGRLTSIRLGLQAWREHPWIGVGPGNVLLEMDAQYARVLPGVKGLRPHNQFVSALVGGGVVGFLVLVICLIAIGFGRRRWRDPRYFAVFTILVLSMLVENTLETSVGVALFAKLLLLYGHPPYRKPG